MAMCIVYDLYERFNKYFETNYDFCKFSKFSDILQTQEQHSVQKRNLHKIDVCFDPTFVE